MFDQLFFFPCNVLPRLCCSHFKMFIPQWTGPVDLFKRYGENKITNKQKRIRRAVDNEKKILFHRLDLGCRQECFDRGRRREKLVCSTSSRQSTIDSICRSTWPVAVNSSEIKAKSGRHKHYTGPLRSAFTD